MWFLAMDEYGIWDDDMVLPYSPGILLGGFVLVSMEIDQPKIGGKMCTLW